MRTMLSMCTIIFLLIRMNDSDEISFSISSKVWSTKNLSPERVAMNALPSSLKKNAMSSTGINYNLPAVLTKKRLRSFSASLPLWFSNCAIKCISIGAMRVRSNLFKAAAPNKNNDPLQVTTYPTNNLNPLPWIFRISTVLSSCRCLRSLAM